MHRIDQPLNEGPRRAPCFTLGDILQAAHEVSEHDAVSLVETFLATRGVRFLDPGAQPALDRLSRELDPRTRVA